MGDPRLGGSYIDEQGVLWIYDYATGTYVPATAGRAEPAPPSPQPAMTPQAAPPPGAENPYLPMGGQGWAERMGGIAPTSVPEMPAMPAPPPPPPPPVPQMAAPAPARQGRSNTPVQVPGGAAAGPDGYVRRPRSDVPSFGPSSSTYSPQAAGGSPSGGGGTSSIYQAIRGRLEGKLGAMAGGTDTAPTDAMYRRSQQRQRQDMRQYEREQNQRTKFNTMFGYTMPFAADILGEGYASGAARDYLSGIPAGELAMLTRGYDNGRFLKKPAAFGRTLTDVYGDIVGNADGYDVQTLMGNLFDSGRNSSLASMFQTAGYPEARYGRNGMYKGTKGGRSEWASPTSQMSQLMNLLAAIYYPQHGAAGADRLIADMEPVFDPWLQKQMMRKPGNYKSILDFARKNLAWYY